MERIICLAAGYAFGLIQTGYLYGKVIHKDIRQYGSGNSGTTNALRVLGKKAGAIVFLGDFLKAVILCLLVRYLYGRTMPEMSLSMPVASASAMLVGMVATEEQVPRETIAGRAMWLNMVLMAPLPPPNQANRGKAVKM